MEQRLTITLTFIPRHYRNDKLLWEHYETVKESHGPLDFTLTLQILKMMILECFLVLFFFNWDSPHARLNSHYEAWSYKKKSKKRPQDTENLFRKNLQLKDAC